MPVDASPYQNRAPQVNLLEQMMQVRDAAGAMGDIEVGKGMQQAIQPDGSVDRNILAQHLKGSVAGSMKATPALTAIEHLRNAGYATDEQGLRTLHAKMGFVGSAISPLVQFDENGKLKPVSQKQVISAAAGMLKQANEYGLKVPDIMSSVTKLQGMTDQQRAETLYGQMVQGQSAQRALEAVMPRTTSADTGPTIEAGIPAGTQLRPGRTSVEKGLGPESQVTDDRRMIPGPDGRMVPNPNYGQPQKLGPGGSGPPRITTRPAQGGPDSPPPVRQAMEGVTGVQRGPVTDPQTGRVLAPAAAPPAAPPAGVVPAAPASAAGVPAPVPAAAPATFAQRFPTGLPPGETEQMGQSAAAYTKELEAARGYQDRVQPLREAIPRLERLGTRGTGPGTETYNDIKSFAQTWGLPIPNAAALKDFAEAKKYLTQNATALAPPGTNIPSVTAAFEANPNVSQPNKAATYLAKSMLTLARLRQASLMAFKESGLPGNRFNEFAADWIAKQDPKAYGADLWSKEDRAKLSKTLKPNTPQAKRFRSSVDEARRFGVLGDVERPEEK